MSRSPPVHLILLATRDTGGARSEITWVRPHRRTVSRQPSQHANTTSAAPFAISATKPREGPCLLPEAAAPDWAGREKDGRHVGRCEGEDGGTMEGAPWSSGDKPEKVLVKPGGVGEGRKGRRFGDQARFGRFPCGRAQQTESWGERKKEKKEKKDRCRSRFPLSGIVSPERGERDWLRGRSRACGCLVSPCRG